MLVRQLPSINDIHRLAGFRAEPPLGFRALLNAIGILQTSKYSQATTWIFALLFLALGAAGFYVTIAKNNPKLGLLVAVGPWLLAVAVLFITLVTSDYK